MSGFTYVVSRPETETSNELEKKIANYARERKVRMPRARRQLIEKGLAVVEAGLPEMTKRGKRTFQEKIERPKSLIRSGKNEKKEVKIDERSFA